MKQDAAKREENEPPIELAELRETVMGEEELDDYFRDLDQLADILSIQTKGLLTERAEGAGSNDLAGAKANLLNRACRALQISYGHEGQLYIDTVMRVAEGFRVIRMPVPDEAGGDGRPASQGMSSECP